MRRVVCRVCHHGSDPGSEAGKRVVGLCLGSDLLCVIIFIHEPYRAGLSGLVYGQTVDVYVHIRYTRERVRFDH